MDSKKSFKYKVKQDHLSAKKLNTSNTQVRFSPLKESEALNSHRNNRDLVSGLSIDSDSSEEGLRTYRDRKPTVVIDSTDIDGGLPRK